MAEKLQYQKRIVNYDNNGSFEWVECSKSEYDTTRALKRIVAIPTTPPDELDKVKSITAYGLKTRVWTFNEKYGYGCSECCTGDRCDEDCNGKTTPYHGRRRQCPHCKGKGWIPKEDATINKDFFDSPTMRYIKKKIVDDIDYFDKKQVADEAGEVFVWVKASERFPIRKDYEYSGDKVFVRSIQSKVGGMLLIDEFYKLEGKENIEWLSPAPPSGEDAGEGKSNYWHLGNISRMKEMAEIQNSLKEAVELIQYFVDRVDAGTIRSKITYSKYKEFLSSLTAPKP